MKKKVFSKKKCREVALADGLLSESEIDGCDWPDECEGLTKDQIRQEYGYAIDDDWLVEVDDGN